MRQGIPVTEEIWESVLDLLASGLPLSKICARDGYPDARTVTRRCINNEEFRAKYAEARQHQGDSIADVALIEATGAMAPQDVAAARLAYDARRWYASKVAPKNWGDKSVVAHEGQDGGAVRVETVIVTGVRRAHDPKE